MIKIPTIKKVKIKVDPNATPQEVGDEMSRGLHMIKHFEKEMNHHPFGHKLIVIGKPMAMNGLHNAMGMMDPEVMHHMCHHRGHHHCKHMVNNIVKCIILFLIWKIFESIDNRCCGMCESECIKKFKNDLSECYDRIGKINVLLNESCLGLSEESRIAMKIKGLEVIESKLGDMVTKASIKHPIFFNALNRVGSNPITTYRVAQINSNLDPVWGNIISSAYVGGKVLGSVVSQKVKPKIAKRFKRRVSEAAYNPLQDPLLRKIVSAANAFGYKIYDSSSRVPRLNMDKNTNIFAAQRDPKFRRTLVNMGVTPQQFNRVTTNLRKPVSAQAVKANSIARMNTTSMY